ncbi:MAG: cyclic nucleotide-binding domain-containing protein [Pyrinomonadaceae bacterium]
MDKVYFATHLASVLTLLAYLVKDILWLRALTILACIAGIIFNYFVASTPLWAVINWNLIFIAINVVQIVLILRERRGVNFTEEERELYQTLFKNFAPFEFMKLLRVGEWKDAKKGQVLAVEKQRLDNILLIYNGLLAVEAAGQQIAQLTDGNLIGEMSFVKEGVASATVRVIRPTRYISWPKAELRHLLKRNPNMRYSMEQVFTGDLVRKLTPRFRADTWQSD